MFCYASPCCYCRTHRVPTLPLLFPPLTPSSSLPEHSGFRAAPPLTPSSSLLVVVVGFQKTGLGLCRNKRLCLRATVFPWCPGPPPHLLLHLLFFSTYCSLPSPHPLLVFHLTAVAPLYSPLFFPSHKLGLAEDRMILWAWGTPWSSQARVTSVDSHLARKSSSFNSRFENSSSGKHDCSHWLLTAN